MSLTRAAAFTIAVLSSVSVVFPSVVEDVARYAQPRLGDARQVANLDFAIEHLKITLPAGVCAQVLGQDGTGIGVYCSGAGTFVYETVSKDEFPVVRHNAKTNDVGVNASADAIRITSAFESVLVLGNVLPKLDGATAPAPAAAFAKHAELFAKHETVPAGHLFALQKANASDARVARVQISGPRPYVYVLDGADSLSESLTVLRKPEFQSVQFKRSLFGSLLSRQPFGRKARTEAPPRVLLTDVDVNLIASEKDDASMTVVETFVPQRTPAGALRLDLYSEYYFDADKEPRRFNVRKITDEQGRSLPFNHSAGEVVVGLAAPAPAGKPIKLQFEIDGNFLYRPGGDNYWELGVEPWFPQPELNEQAYTFHALVKVKKPFIAFAPGKTLRREVEGDYNVIEAKVEQPVQFAAILAGKYHFQEETRNGITVRVASYAMKNPTAVKQLTNLAFGAIEYYPTFLGPFPFTELNIIEKNDFGYGQAPPSFVFITKEAFTPKLGEANEWVKGINSRFAHEIAHQYWGHVVKMGSSEEQWLTEAFAEYSAALFLKAAKAASEYDRALINWRTDAREAGAIASIPLANRLSNPGDPMTVATKRQQLVYSKGAYLLAALHRELGDQAFLTFLKSYQRSFRWKHGSTADVIGLLNFMTKKDYAPFFEQYFYGTELPEVPKR